MQETGRWISAVFYGVIKHVLPYINGFVMAIKEIIRALALFVGYELPNSSGQTGGIFDGIEDSVGGVSDGLEDVNSGLDSANDKAKKFKTYLMGFDVAQVIPDQSDSDKDGSSGTGGMTVDPKILDALNKYKYLFDDIQMKATDIRDKLLGWKDAIGSAIKENIFEPMWNSWQKYGSSITKNLSDTGSNIGHIFSGIFDVIGEKWKPFFQSASDLLFSLLDTASLVADTITSLLARVWDHGGKTLFEGIADLATAFLKLATSVNDNFIQPLIKGFSKSLGPVIAGFIGLVMSLLGELLKNVGGFLTWLAESKTAVLLLGTAFTTMFLAIKVTKILELASAFGGTHSILAAVKSLLLQNSTLFSKLWISLQNGKSILSQLKTSWNVANTALSNMFVKMGLATVTTEGNIVATLGLKTAQEATAASTGLLNTALTFLANHPMAIIVGAIATVIGAFALFGSSQEDAKYDMEDYSQSVQDQINRINDLKTSMDSARQSAEDRMASSEAEIKTLDLQIETLKKMGGESGYVENMAAAEKLVDEINQKLPDTVKLTENGRLEWQKTPEEIRKCIEALKEKARVEAYSELYTEAIKTQIKAQREHGKAVEELTTKEQRVVDLQQRQEELQKMFRQHGDSRDSWWQTDEAKAYSIELGKIKTELSQLPADVDGLKKAVSESSSVYDEASDEVEYWGKALSTNNDIMKSTSDAMSGLTDKNRDCVNELGTSLSSIKNQLKDYSDGSIELNQKQVQSALEAKDEILLSYAERANEYGKTYDQMIQILMEQGISLTDEEKNQLKQSINNFKDGMSREEQTFKNSKKRILEILKSSNKDLTKEQEEEYSTLLESLKKHGGKISTEYSSQYQSMIRALKENNVDLNTEQGEAYSRMFTLLQEYGFDFNDEQTRQFAKGLELAIASGDEQGKEFIGNLKTSISKDSIEPEARSQWWKAQNVFVDPITGRVTITNTTDVANGARSELTGKLSNLPSSVQRAVGNVWSAVDYVTQYFGNSPITTYLSSYIGNKYGAWSNFNEYMKANPFQATVDIASGSFKYILSLMGGRGYATGGFPSMGEMFIAREAGPEFVGTMGGRTAVANNYQIENGIYRAVKSAMQGTGNSKQTIHLTFNLPDGTKIEKVIEDYNDYINRNGGKGGFDI